MSAGTPNPAAATVPGGDLPAGVRVLHSPTLDYLRSHPNPGVGALSGPNVIATHPVHGDLKVVLHTFERFCMVSAEHDDGAEYILTDSPANLTSRPVRLTDIGSFWIRHGVPGMQVLAAMDEFDGIVDAHLRPFSPSPLADRLAAAGTALT